ncbi:MAG: molybdopterin-binding protein [Anaerolineales bacterium]|jgi:competence/damage-inducible protein CinA-like protein|nr:molybdopterin-binding protein [Anaerolineales bacterium]
MTSAEIITIGTEILLGEIVDTNSAHLARKLRDLNVDVFRTSTVGDNIERIAAVIRETLLRTEIIITTGGLGPTIDDPTREAVARAVGAQVEFRAELWTQIVERMARFGRSAGENQKRQAYVPAGATAIKNPVGTAPAFIVEQGEKCIIALPGVPREMEYLLENDVIPYLRNRYQLRGLIKARILHVAGLGESVIDEQIGDLEELSNPMVGLAAHAGLVDIRITAKAETSAAADELIRPIEARARQRLGQAIFGVDSDSLESVTLAQLAARGWNLTGLEINLGGELLQRLAKSQHPAYRGGQSLPELPAGSDLLQLTQAHSQICGLGLRLAPAEGQVDLEIALVTPKTARLSRHSYGGPPKSAPAWAANTALNLLRLESLPE